MLRTALAGKEAQMQQYVKELGSDTVMMREITV
jgi:hypothetical protein